MGPKRTKQSPIPYGSVPVFKKGGVAHVTVKLRAGLPSLRGGEARVVVLA